jgi:hypothetical protein
MSAIYAISGLATKYLHSRTGSSVPRRYRIAAHIHRGRRGAGINEDVEEFLIVVIIIMRRRRRK